jgi:hypothetical protein
MTTALDIAIAATAKAPRSNMTGWCQQFVGLCWEVAKGRPTPNSYASADAANRASTVVSRDPMTAPPGAIHMFKENHVGFALGSGLMADASSRVNIAVANLGKYILIHRVKDYPLTYLGWSYTNGNRERITGLTDHSVKPVEPNQRKIISDRTARQRTQPSTNSTYNPNENINVNTIITPLGFVESKIEGGIVGGSNIWLKLTNGKFIHISCVTNKTTENLINLTEPELEVPDVIENPETPIEIPEEENPVVDTNIPETDTDPIVDINLDELDDALETTAEHIGPLLPEQTRNSIYKIMSNAGLVLAAVGASALSTAGVVGGDIGAKIAAGSAIATTVGLALSAGANKLAEINSSGKSEN